MGTVPVAGVPIGSGCYVRIDRVPEALTEL